MAREHIGDNDVSDDDVRKVALGAIKFTDFSQSRQTNILFDWDRMFSLQGFSGPYVQYAAVRINSILDKLKTEDVGFAVDNGYDWKEEAALLKLLATYPEVVKLAAEEYEPHKIAQYVYDLAREFNKYYENVSISDSKGVARDSRISLLYVLKNNFNHALGLVGIEVPERM